MKQGVQFTEADWTRDHSWLRDELRREMYITAFSYEDSQKVAVEQDPEIQQARLMPCRRRRNCWASKAASKNSGPAVRVYAVQE